MPKGVVGSVGAISGFWFSMMTQVRVCSATEYWPMAVHSFARLVRAPLAAT